MKEIEVLGLLMIIASFLNAIGLSVIYYRNFRFATLIFDLLPYYPVFCIGGIAITSLGYIFLGLKMWVFIVLLVILSINGYLLPGFLEWRSFYSLDYYSNFLKRIQERDDIIVIPFSEWLSHKTPDKEKITVLIRHDVDINLDRARRMAKIEKSNNISSCYLFRNNAERYTIEEAEPIIQEFMKQSFEIGFHYETIANANGDLNKAQSLFEEELNTMRKIAPINLIAAHGDKFRNRQLIDNNLIDLKRLEVTSAYFIGFDRYISEAGGNRLFLRDNKYTSIKEELESLFSETKGTVVEILIHPDWWF